MCQTMYWYTIAATLAITITTKKISRLGHGWNVALWKCGTTWTGKVPTFPLESVKLWTASTGKYKELAPVVFEPLFTAPHHRFDCIWEGKRTCKKKNSQGLVKWEVKPLRKYWRRKSTGMTRENTICIDDTPSTWQRNHGNVIPIQEFIASASSSDEEKAEKKDTELERIQHLFWTQIG